MTGGHAFPASHFDLADNEHGMTLRDYFAAKAMGNMISGTWPDGNDRPEIAKRAYAMADAMLAERAKGK